MQSALGTGAELVAEKTQAGHKVAALVVDPGVELADIAGHEVVNPLKADARVVLGIGDHLAAGWWDADFSTDGDLVAGVDIVVGAIQGRSGGAVSRCHLLACCAGLGYSVELVGDAH